MKFETRETLFSAEDDAMEKKFDAVKEMRSIRDRLQKEHEQNPALRRERLKAIHKKYRMKGESYRIQRTLGD